MLVSGREVSGEMGSDKEEFASGWRHQQACGLDGSSKESLHNQERYVKTQDVMQFYALWPKIGEIFKVRLSPGYFSSFLSSDLPPYLRLLGEWGIFTSTHHKQCVAEKWTNLRAYESRTWVRPWGLSSLGWRVCIDMSQGWWWHSGINIYAWGKCLHLLSYLEERYFTDFSKKTFIIEEKEQGGLAIKRVFVAKDSFSFSKD